MERRRLKRISDLVNQFVASITHKPLESRLDHARVKAFITALRGELIATGKKPTEVFQSTELSVEERQTFMDNNLKALKKMKEERKQ